MPADPRSAAPLLSIQALRAAAAASVLVQHAGYDADTIAARVHRSGLGLGRFFDWSFGIHLFFVISGFIMVRTARGFGEPGAARRFLTRRMLRVAPLYWLMTTLVLVGALVAPGLLNEPVGGWGLVFGSYLFWPVMRLDGEVRPILGQGWTLDYEMVFYLLLGGAMVLPRRAGLTALSIGLLGLAALGKVAPPSWPPAIVWTNRLLLEFLFGLLAGLACEAGCRLNTLPAVLLGLVGLAGAILLGPISGESPVGADLWIRQGLPAALIVCACVLAPPWRSTRPVLVLAVLGDASYSLYLTHPFTVRVLRAAWTAGVGDRLPVWTFVAVACPAAVLVGLAVWRWVERPLSRAAARIVGAQGIRRTTFAGDGGQVGLTCRAGSPMYPRLRPAVRPVDAKGISDT